MASKEKPKMKLVYDSTWDNLDYLDDLDDDSVECNTCGKYDRADTGNTCSECTHHNCKKCVDSAPSSFTHWPEPDLCECCAAYIHEKDLEHFGNEDLC